MSGTTRAPRRLHFDYGKFDYVLDGDPPVLLDTNETIGRSADIYVARHSDVRHGSC